MEKIPIPKFKVGDNVWVDDVTLVHSKYKKPTLSRRKRCGVISVVRDWNLHTYESMRGGIIEIKYLVYWFDEAGSKFYDESEIIRLMTKEEVAFERL